jgi:hypothetical protein
MRLHRYIPVALLAVGLGACDHDLLDIRPVDEIDDETAIVDAASAQAALNGAYAALQDGNYYGTDYVIYGDLMSDNAEHEGTFGTYSQANRHALLPTNVTLDGIWTAIYDGINRVNILIEKVPTLGIEADVADGILAESYALRALHYHNLVRAWGDAPLVLAPLSLDEAGQVSRAAASQVYQQILADLDQAEALFTSAGTSNTDRVFTTPGFVDALQARVNLYMENWADAAAEAMELVNSPDYGLATNYADLFPADEGATPEDIFLVAFTPDVFNNFGYYYQYAGRFEVGATQDIYTAYDQDNDVRWEWNFGDTDVDEVEVTKFPTTIGAENFHVIRYAEVLLTLAEALARQGGGQNLSDAVDYVNLVRARAGVAEYDLAGDFGGDAQQVIDAIWLERRLELAFEGDRWFDLVRTGRAMDVLPTLTDPDHTLWPIPQGELDVAPNLTQNPGY